MTEVIEPAIAETPAQIRDHIRSGTPFILPYDPADADKSGLWNSMLSEPTSQSSGRRVRFGAAELDQFYNALESAESIVVLFDPIADVSASRPNEVAALTPIASSAGTADHPWLSAVGSLFAGRLILPDAGRRTPGDARKSVRFTACLHNVSSWLAFDELLFPRLRQELLRLVSRLRIVMRLRLIYILSGLSSIPEAINFILLLLAVARCYGRRTEPSDYILPALTSMSVVIGEAARLC